MNTPKIDHRAIFRSNDFPQYKHKETKPTKPWWQWFLQGAFVLVGVAVVLTCFVELTHLTTIETTTTRDGDDAGPRTTTLREYVAAAQRAQQQQQQQPQPQHAKADPAAKANEEGVSPIPTNRQQNAKQQHRKEDQSSVHAGPWGDGTSSSSSSSDKNKNREVSPQVQQLQHEGQRLWDAGNFEQASLRYKRATVLDPQGFFTWLQLAKCYEELGEYSDMVKASRSSIQANPEFVPGYYHLAHGYRYLDELTKSTETIEKGLSIAKSKNPKIYQDLVHLQTQILELKQTREDFQIITYCRNAETALQHDDRDSMEEYLKLAVTVNAHHPAIAMLVRKFEGESDDEFCQVYGCVTPDDNEIEDEPRSSDLYRRTQDSASDLYRRTQNRASAIYRRTQEAASEWSRWTHEGGFSLHTLTTWSMTASLSSSDLMMVYTLLSSLALVLLGTVFVLKQKTNKKTTRTQISTATTAIVTTQTSQPNTSPAATQITKKLHRSIVVSDDEEDDDQEGAATMTSRVEKEEEELKNNNDDPGVEEKMKSEKQELSAADLFVMSILGDRSNETKELGDRNEEGKKLVCCDDEEDDDDTVVEETVEAMQRDQQRPSTVSVAAPSSDSVDLGLWGTSSTSEQHGLSAADLFVMGILGNRDEATELVCCDDDDDDDSDEEDDDKPLPFGWSKEWDETHGRHFYQNSVGPVAQWERPNNEQVEEAAAAAEKLLPPGWSIKWDPTHERNFYHNSVGPVSQWERPNNEQVEAAAGAHLKQQQQGEAAAAAVEKELPHGWSIKWDPKHGRNFYHNSVGPVSQWERPNNEQVEAAVAAHLKQQQHGEAAAAAVEKPLPPGWSIKWDPTHERNFYHNSVGPVSQWERPNKRQEQEAAAVQLQQQQQVEAADGAAAALLAKEQQEQAAEVAAVQLRDQQETESAAAAAALQLQQQQQTAETASAVAVQLQQKQEAEKATTVAVLLAKEQQAAEENEGVDLADIPMKVMESLPPSIQDAFKNIDKDQLAEELDFNDPKDSAYHTKRCADSGLWNTNEQEEEETEEKEGVTAVKLQLQEEAAVAAAAAALQLQQQQNEAVAVAAAPSLADEQQEQDIAVQLPQQPEAEAAAVVALLASIFTEIPTTDVVRAPEQSDQRQYDQQHQTGAMEDKYESKINHEHDQDDARKVVASAAAGDQDLVQLQQQQQAEAEVAAAAALLAQGQEEGGALQLQQQQEAEETEWVGWAGKKETSAALQLQQQQQQQVAMAAAAAVAQEQREKEEGEEAALQKEREKRKKKEKRKERRKIELKQREVAALQKERESATEAAAVAFVVAITNKTTKNKKMGAEEQVYGIGDGIDIIEGTLTYTVGIDKATSEVDGDENASVDDEMEEEEDEEDSDDDDNDVDNENSVSEEEAKGKIADDTVCAADLFVMNILGDRRGKANESVDSTVSTENVVLGGGVPTASITGCTRTPDDLVVVNKYNKKKQKELAKKKKKEEKKRAKEKDRKASGKRTVCYYHQAATNRKPGIKIDHIVLLHGAHTTKEIWKETGILNMFRNQFTSIAVTAVNLPVDATHVELLCLLRKLEHEGLISLPLAALVTPSASGSSITKWLQEQIVAPDEKEDDADDNKKDGAVKKTDNFFCVRKKEERDKRQRKEQKMEIKKHRKIDIAKIEEEEKKNDKEGKDEDKPKVPFALLPEYVHRWVPIATYDIMNCTENQLKLLKFDNEEEKEHVDPKKFKIITIYGNTDKSGHIVSERLEKHAGARIEKLNGRHPVYMDCPEVFVPTIGWEIVS